MEILNPFDSSAFDMASLTAAINVLPNNYGRLREMGLFVDKSITTRTTLFEEQSGVLNLLPTKPVGSPGTVAAKGSRKLRSFAVPHIPHDDVLLPSDYQGVRAFGSASQMATYAQIMNDKLQAMRNKHAITLEHLRWGALKGKILDADASELFDLYSEFGITATEVDFLLGTAGTDVAAKCRQVVRHIEKNLQGEVMSNVHCMVSEEFFDKLIAHANVEKFYINHVAGLSKIVGAGSDPRKAFEFGGITFEEHSGQCTDINGTVRRFIVAQEGHAFPMGTMDTFKTVFAPGDFLDTANTLGIELYARREIRKFNRGVDIHSQSNPLPICLRPALLVKVKTSN
jgi:hypothetical protein